MNDNHTIKRLPRLTAILNHLQSNKVITAGSLSKKFNVSIRTIYRDIRSLEESGVPVITEEGKGFSLMDGYRIPPVMFTEKEALSLITLEQIVLKMYDESLKKEFISSVEKIKAVLRLYSKEKSEIISQRLYIGKNFENIIKSSCLVDLEGALVNRLCVRIFYKALDETMSERIVEPFSFYHNPEENWLMAAFCRLRSDFRIFRIDRIESFTVLDEVFPPHKISMKQFVEKYL
ncbi:MULTISPECIES: helix-turn-helix transcriptional regulator [Chryseobacterium]|uniref:DNA-binding transcriptional regulator YafY n=1 Tax=Chryseobacterium camelliae TaxID=1265445 RepID=A0ABU0TKP7_9FLAO|nr:MULTISPECIES: WYL domain-containing protein [Chryseobacterium]MDT3408530.1 putative DNA-binding transcriptional regulator YafY [Pseudacidovorax intermedius]MDQ1097615.1 putative DNA-binding transcriptional regulator YafY [Chryseobacterium camelliae]MDQ1101544.1 putative DNA-binding transcriptional regulator YafY [Chryseobacterium sp. SORGH_AS_1048]MDR6084987.1 putative DNA-binding transcriptional regulator YafY [Chryseobacterium sp. SORGH_AS_0909]MDR6129341.1 putative DNA-binding transcript